jgi:hypothetical protein
MDNALNLVAMIASAGGMIALLMLAAKMVGGALGVAFRLVTAGIFFSVFLHAGFELAESFGVFGEGVLMHVMGLLITIGSLLFIAAGYIGLKAFR